jgi:uncharacterized phiE125 gp8 family phage protein
MFVSQSVFLQQRPAKPGVVVLYAIRLNTFMFLKTVSTGSGTLLDLTDAKTYLRVNISTDDTLITDLCSLATQIVQDETGLRFFADVYNEYRSAFPIPSPRHWILTRYPVQSINSVQYYDLANNLQTYTTYDSALPTNTQARISPTFGTFYPVTYPRPDAVVCNYTTGFSTIPLAAIQAARLLVGHFYTNRESENQGRTSELQFGLDRLFNQITKGGYY